MMDLLKIAHRGYSEMFPENTIPAFLKAADCGAEMIEFDVHLSKDSHAVVIHDNDIDRTSNGSGAVKDFTLKELKDFDYNFLKIPDLGHVPIPTLEEVIDAVPQRVLLNIELKNCPYKYEGIEETVIEIIKKKKLSERVIISSFDHFALEKVKKIAPELKTGMLYEGGWIFFREEVHHLAVYSLHPAIDTIDIEQLRWASSQGLRVYPWVAKSIKDIEFLKLNNIADGVMVNDLALFEK
jgi:glycerophosphoryl diester phosphodiesterase